MRKFFTIIFVAIGISASAQKIEFGVQANSGLFSFVGESAKMNTNVYYNDQSRTASFGHSFGGRNGLNLGFAGNFKWVSTFNLFFASELGFEYSKSKIAVSSLYWEQEEAAKGKANLRLSSIYFAPTIGYRFKLNKVNIDLGVGVDVSRLVGSSKKVLAISKESYKKIDFVIAEYYHNTKGYQYDLRPHANLKIAYKQYGIFAGYSHGTTNYYKDMAGSSSVQYVTSRLWRMGISYQLK